MKNLECGFAQCTITPVPNEVYLDGYGFRVTPAEGLRNELYVKVCVFKWGDERFAIATFDICGFNREIVQILKEHISNLNNLELSKISVCATHTHAGPACGVLEDLPINIIYWNIVGEKAGRMVSEAFQVATAGHFDFTFGKELTSTFNRRGRELVDRRVRIGGFFDNSGILKGVITSAACHAVIRTDMLISSDYLSVLTRQAAIEFPNVPLLFLQGRGADINPYFTEEFTQDEQCEMLGGELKDSVFDAILRLDAKADDQYHLASDCRQAVIPMLPYPSVNDLNNAIQKYKQLYYDAQTVNDKRYPLRELNWNKKALCAILNGQKPDIMVQIQVMELSDNIVFVMIPFELFTLTGQTIEDMMVKWGYSPESIFVIGYANGTNGYLAPEDEYNYGGYEIVDAAHWYGLPQCSEHSERAVLDVVAEITNKLNCVRSCINTH